MRTHCLLAAKAADLFRPLGKRSVDTVIPKIRNLILTINIVIMTINIVIMTIYIVILTINIMIQNTDISQSILCERVIGKGESVCITPLKVAVCYRLRCPDVNDEATCVCTIEFIWKVQR